MLAVNAAATLLALRPVAMAANAAATGTAPCCNGCQRCCCYWHRALLQWLPTFLRLTLLRLMSKPILLLNMITISQQQITI